MGVPLQYRLGVWTTKPTMPSTCGQWQSSIGISIGTSKTLKVQRMTSSTAGGLVLPRILNPMQSYI